MAADRFLRHPGWFLPEAASPLMLPRVWANRPAMPDLETPCIKLCVLDPDSKYCRGCGRSLAEIERWTAFSDEERRRIMAELPGRIAACAMQTAGRS